MHIHYQPLSVTFPLNATQVHLVNNLHFADQNTAINTQTRFKDRQIQLELLSHLRESLLEFDFRRGGFPAKRKVS